MSDDKTPDLVHECDLEEAPEKVWRALVEPELVERWLTQGEPGLDCELVEQDPGREARYALNEAEGETSEVRFRIAAAEGGGTHLVIEQSRAATAEVTAFPSVRTLGAAWAENDNSGSFSLGRRCLRSRRMRGEDISYPGASVLPDVGEGAHLDAPTPLIRPLRGHLLPREKDNLSTPIGDSSMRQVKRPRTPGGQTVMGLRRAA